VESGDGGGRMEGESWRVFDWNVEVLKCGE